MRKVFWKYKAVKGFLSCEKSKVQKDSVIAFKAMSLSNNLPGLSCYSSFRRSHTSMLWHFKIFHCYVVWGLNWKKIIKPISTMLKGINKCIEKENGNKHWGFYSECYNADESPECTWKAKLRVALDKWSHRVVRWGQGALSIFRQTSAASISQQLLDFWYCWFKGGSAFLPRWGRSSPSCPSTFTVVSEGPLGFLWTIL